MGLASLFIGLLFVSLNVFGAPANLNSIQSDRSEEDITCSQMLMESARSYADYTKQVDQAAAVENDELKTKGIRPVAKYLPPIFIHPEVEKGMVSYIRNAQSISKIKNLKSAKKSANQNLSRFISILEDRAPKFMGECRRYVQTLSRNCLQKMDRLKKQQCRESLNRRMKPVLMSHLPLSKFKTDLDNANILDDRLAAAVQKDNSRVVKKLLRKRIKIKQNHRSAIPLIMHEAMIHNSKRVMRYLLSLKGFHKISKKYFLKRTTLLEKGIQSGSEGAVLLYLHHKGARLTKKEAYSLLKLAKGYRRLKVKKLLETKLKI